MNFTLEMQKILEEVKRQNKRRKKNLGKMSISENGTKIFHGLGIIPDEFNITPIGRDGSAPASWYHYSDPDSSYIYIASSVNGVYLVCVAGG